MEKIHLTNLNLILDDHKKEYMAGDEVSGLLTISMKGRLLLSNVKISFTCMGEAKWVENPGVRYQREGKVYHNKTNFFDYTYQMPKQYADNCLGAGDHVMPFKFRLPEEGIPSSFESIHGSVSYYVEAVIDEPAINEVHRIGEPIIVESPMRNNLNISVGGTAEKDLSIFGSGTLSLSANVVKKGFTAGEVIEVQCSVENQSSVDVVPRVTLYQTQIYMCGERHKSLEVALTEPIVGHKVKSETDGAEIISVPIPQEASLSIKSPIISIKYFVHITLDIPHAIDLHINLPIIVTNKSALGLN
ncbi:unnamed protein product [Medioppia subpectinata]|uniref:Arrestin C-terminal-like domain-containing protein n=1 Tax=Medioppia subpectinata TaxID=1979941 RepID=A0A7R9L3R3_9ACAR|nr:unnamed protein product [Medioppia subpectinata]CAG2114742.1 unnamed protein product [Medioppia subpectinata]